MNSELYCPICARTILADNIEEVESGEHECFIFVHDNIPHMDMDIDALNTGLQ